MQGEKKWRELELGLDERGRKRLAELTWDQRLMLRAFMLGVARGYKIRDTGRLRRGG